CTRLLPPDPKGIPRLESARHPAHGLARPGEADLVAPALFEGGAQRFALLDPCEDRRETSEEVEGAVVDRALERRVDERGTQVRFESHAFCEPTAPMLQQRAAQMRPEGGAMKHGAKALQTLFAQALPPYQQ